MKIRVLGGGAVKLLRDIVGLVSLDINSEVIWEPPTPSAPVVGLGSSPVMESNSSLGFLTSGYQK